MSTRPEGPSKFRDNTYDPATDRALIHDTLRSRPKYFDGQFLTAHDLNREQNYLLARQADFARALGFGVIEGLRVSGATDGHVLNVTAGAGVTPAGGVVQLPTDRDVDLGEIERMRELNARFGLSQEPQASFASLDGIFVLGLREVEFTANPVPVFPATLSGRDKLRDGDIVEATAFTLVPYESGAVEEHDTARAIARVAREIFLDGRAATTREGVLPLAMLRLRGGHVLWMDEFLVRREAGDDDRFGFGFAPRALAEAHFHHYRARAPRTPGRSAAADHFEILPPGGPLPPEVVDLKALTQTFFPPEAKVEIALVPEDELPVLMEESLHLPPLNLALKPEDNDALAILVLALVPRAQLDDDLALVAARPLAAGHAPGRGARIFDAFSRLQLLGSVDPDNEADAIAKREDEAAADAEASLAESAWKEALAKSRPQLWYVRRRNITPPGDIAPVPAATLALRGEEDLLKDKIAELEDEREKQADAIRELKKENDELRAKTGEKPEPPKGVVITEDDEIKTFSILNKMEMMEPFWILRTVATTPAAGMLTDAVHDLTRKPGEGTRNDLNKIFTGIAERAELTLDDGVNALRSAIRQGIRLHSGSVKRAEAEAGFRGEAADERFEKELLERLTEFGAGGAFTVIGSAATMRARTLLDSVAMKILRKQDGDGKGAIFSFLDALLEHTELEGGGKFGSVSLARHTREADEIFELILKLRDNGAVLRESTVERVARDHKLEAPTKETVVTDGGTKGGDTKDAAARDVLAERTKLAEATAKDEKALKELAAEQDAKKRALKNPRIAAVEKTKISAEVAELSKREEAIRGGIAVNRAELRRLAAGGALKPAVDTKGGVK